MSYLEKLLAESKKKRDAATPGPWKANFHSGTTKSGTPWWSEILANNGENLLMHANAHLNEDEGNFYLVEHLIKTNKAKDEIIVVLVEALNYYGQRMGSGNTAREALQKAESLAKEALSE